MKKILIIDTYYSAFLKDYYIKHPLVKFYNYERQKKVLMDFMFGTADFYSNNLIKLGYKAQDVIVNNETLQRRWAEENSINLGKISIFDRLRSLPYTNWVIGNPGWLQKIVLEQVRKYKPDVVYMQNLSVLNPGSLRQIKRYAFLVGQIASPLPPAEYLKEFNLILTSLPNFVRKFRKMGIKSEYFKIGFEPRILSKFGKVKKKYDVTFIGSFTPHHQKGTRILEKVGRSMPIQIWGQGINYLRPSSPLRKYYHGEAWGLQMYKILAESKIVINRHIGIAENYANNMRLFEATGMSSMLITDKKKNLGKLFKVGEEVVEYSSPGDLLFKIKYYLKHDNERIKIAKAGQRRTLREHTYLIRMKELVKIIEKYV